MPFNYLDHETSEPIHTISFGNISPNFRQEKIIHFMYVGLNRFTVKATLNRRLKLPEKKKKASIN